MGKEINIKIFDWKTRKRIKDTIKQLLIDELRDKDNEKYQFFTDLLKLLNDNIKIEQIEKNKYNIKTFCTTEHENKRFGGLEEGETIQELIESAKEDFPVIHLPYTFLKISDDELKEMLKNPKCDNNYTEGFIRIEFQLVKIFSFDIEE